MIRPKWIVGIVGMFILLVVVAGCSSGFDMTDSDDSTITQEAEEHANSVRGEVGLTSMQEEGSVNQVREYDESVDNDRAAEDMAVEPVPLAQEDGDTADIDDSYDRKIIREQFIEQEVQDLAAVLADIERTAERITDAYVESLEEWTVEERDREEYRALVTLRIPVDEYADFLTQVEEQGNIIHRHLSGRDVTEEFVDNESRLRNLTVHEERILAIYEEAENIEDMLQLEQELSRIRSSIEELQGRQNYLEHVTSTVRLRLELFEVEEEEYLSGQSETPLFQEAGLGFQKSISDIAYLATRLLVLAITVAPYLIILAIIIGITARIYFKWRKTIQTKQK